MLRDEISKYLVVTYVCAFIVQATVAATAVASAVAAAAHTVDDVFWLLWITLHNAGRLSKDIINSKKIIR